MRFALLFIVAFFLTGCGDSGPMFGETSTDSVERGLSYIAMAIVFHGFIRGILNK